MKMYAYYFVTVQIMKSETSRISHEQQGMKEKIKVSIVLSHFQCSFNFEICFQENAEKIKVFKVLPYLVSNVVEVSCVTVQVSCV